MIVDHVLEARLRRIAEESNILEPGQTGYRFGRSTDINMRKIQHLTDAAKKAGIQIFRCDVDFRNAFNSMSQAALWAVLRRLNIPDVDLLENLYRHTTVRLAPNDAEAATITFQTGVAQGSVLSPLLFILFVNTLARLLTAVGQENNIEHGIDNLPGLNNVFFCDDLSLWAKSKTGMQTLLEVLADFEEWSGIRLNLKKTVGAAVGESKATKQTKSGLQYQGKPIRMAADTDPIRYLGFWATANGDYQEAKDRVMQRTREAVELIRHHPFTPEMATDIFQAKGVGLFRYSAPFVDWTEEELEELLRMWSQGYKLAWHLNCRTATAPFTFPAECGGLGLHTPVGVLTNALMGHVERTMLHDDVTRDCMLNALEEAKTLALANSFEEIQAEVVDWSWRQVNQNVWLRLAKGLSLCGMHMDLRLPDEQNGNDSAIGWAAATRPLRRALSRMRDISSDENRWQQEVWSRPDTNVGQGARHVEQDTWQRAWQGDKVFWKAARKLHKAGIRSPLQLPMQQLDGNKRRQGEAMPRMLRATGETDGKQAGRPILECVKGALTEGERTALQGFLDLVDWKGQDIVLGGGHSRPAWLREASVGWCTACSREPRLPTDENMPTEQLERSKTTKGLMWSMQGQCCEGCRNSGKNKGVMPWLTALARAKESGQTQRMEAAEIWQQLCQAEQGVISQNLTPGEWKSRLAGIGQQGARGAAEVLRGVFRWIRSTSGAMSINGHDVDRQRLEGTRLIWEHMNEILHPYWRRTWGRQWEELMSARASDLETKADSLARIAQSIRTILSQCEHCQEAALRGCRECELPRCNWCMDNAQDECQGCGAKWTCRKRVRSSSDEEGVVGQLRGRNMHNAGRDFVEEVTDCRWNPDGFSVTEDTELQDRIQFRCKLRGWDPEARRRDIDDLLAKHTGENADAKLIRALLAREQPTLLFFPAQQFPNEPPEFQDRGWWYKARKECMIRRCGRCWQQKVLDHFDAQNRKATCRRPECLECKRLPKSQKERLEEDTEGLKVGLLAVTADPRYIGRRDDPSGGDIIVDGPGLRHILQGSRECATTDMEVWLTTGQIGFAVRREVDEVDGEEETEARIPTGRFLAPQISAFIRKRQTESDSMEEPDDLWEALDELEAAWGRDMEAADGEVKSARRKAWEGPSCPLAMQDPRYLPEVSLGQRLGENWFLNEDMPRSTTGAGYVRVWQEAVRWEERVNGFRVLVGEGLAMSAQPEHEWTIMSAQWQFLKARFADDAGELAQLVPFVAKEAKRQEEFEKRGVRSVSWRLLKALQAATGAEVLIGGTAVASPPFFRSMGRGNCAFWGELEGPAIVLWDHMDDQERDQWRQTFEKRNDWVILCSRNQKTSAQMDQAPPGRDWCVLQRGGTKREERKGRAMRERGWWRRGSVQLCENNCTMACRVPQHQLMGTYDEYGVVQAWFCRRPKEDLNIQLKGTEGDYWLGTEAGSIGAYGFQGAIFATDGSVTHGKMGAGYNELSWQMVGSEWREAQPEEGTVGKLLKHPKAAAAMDQGAELTAQVQQQLTEKGAEDGDYVEGAEKLYCILQRRRRGCLRVGREDEGTSSLRPELAAIEKVLQTTELSEDLLILSDCKTALTEIRKWIGEGLKPCMATTKDADILKAVVARLRQRIEMGAATWLIKIKAHRGEPLNEGADDEASRGCRLPAEDKHWDASTSRILYHWETAEGEERRAPWGQSVRQAVTKKAGWARVALEHRAGYKKWVRRWWHESNQNGRAPNRTEWQQMSTHWWATQREWEIAGARLQQKARGKRQKPDSEVSQEDATWQKKPTLRTWTAEYLLRPEQSRKSLHKWLKNRQVPYRRRRRLLQVMSHSYPCGAFLRKMRRSSTSKCRVCRALRPQVPEAELAHETVGHITSARCVGQSEAATAAHNRCVSEIVKVLGSVEKEKRGVKILTEHGEQAMGTLWANQELNELCSWEQTLSMARQARRARLDQRLKVETKMSDPKQEERICSICMVGNCAGRWTDASGNVVCCQCTAQTVSGLEKDSVCEECWVAKVERQRFDGVAIDAQSKPKRLLIIEVKRVSDTMADYWQRGVNVAEKQYEDLCEGIKNSLPSEWECRFVPIILGKMSISEKAFEEAMEQLGISKAAGKTLRQTLMNVLLEEQDKLLRSFNAQLGENGGVSPAH